MAGLSLVVAAFALAQPAPAAGPGVFTGAVVLRADPAAKADRAVLLAADGRELALVRDDETRKFFLDAHLRGRPVRFTGRVVPEGGKLKVEKARLLVAGRPHEVDYWCENCKLSFSDPGRCLCCGAETVRRETPAE